MTTLFDEDEVLALVASFDGGAVSAFEESGGLAHTLFKGVDFCHNDCAIFRCGILAVENGFTRSFIIIFEIYIVINVVEYIKCFVVQLVHAFIPAEARDYGIHLRVTNVISNSEIIVFSDKTLNLIIELVVVLFLHR